ncbi:hypothetical protein QJS10_CPA02g01462 [Acorus calamus]|uniref:Ribosomal RNA-processing protein 17 n=1 Tax=Acorus calamus TaxID=4465 RepID=A0AAV9FC50_ACOCL|nr:hypothetical protein QJS10_CPA02g01462 [Acorus calamus]
MEIDEASAIGLGPNPVRVRHIKKRALRNKSLTVDFDEKNLRDFVTGFHKRKKKRRKEAQQQLKEKERRKRIEGRKKRKLEREFAVNGGALPEDGAADAGSGSHDECGSELEEEEAHVPSTSISGTKMYDNGDMTIRVTTSELSVRAEDLKTHLPPKPIGQMEKNHNLPVKKKQPMKKVARQRSKKKAGKRASAKKGSKKGRNKK